MKKKLVVRRVIKDDIETRGITTLIKANKNQKQNNKGKQTCNKTVNKGQVARRTKGKSQKSEHNKKTFKSQGGKKMTCGKKKVKISTVEKNKIILCVFVPSPPYVFDKESSFECQL